MCDYVDEVIETTPLSRNGLNPVVSCPNEQKY